MIDYLIRAEDRAVWLTYAQDQGWIDQDSVIAPHVFIDEIGAVAITPGEYDDEGIEITAPVMDDWHHVNLRLLSSDETFGGQLRSAKAANVRGITALEVGVEPTRIQVLSPADITTPIRMWADGMYFAELPEAKKTKRK